MKKILRNRAQCKRCGDIIESFHAHDFKWCICEAIFVDGGLDYLYRGAVNFDEFIELSEVEEVSGQTEDERL